EPPRHQHHDRAAEAHQDGRHDQGHHRARHACRVLAGRQDLGAGAGAHHRHRPAAADQGGPARAGSLSRGERRMTIVAERPAAAAVALEADPAKQFFAVRDIHAYYGESYIVQGVSLDVRKGEILALLGRNGAGKTSTLRTIARMDNPELRSGEIWLEGEPLHNQKSWQASRAGIQLVPEDRRIIQGMTVEENLVLAQVAPGHGMGLDEIYEHFPRLAERRKQ